MRDFIRRHSWALRRFGRSQDGAVTVEAAIWLPFWVFFLFGLGEVALLFNGQARALDITQDVTRAYIVGDIDSASNAEESIKSALSSISKDVDVSYSKSGNIVQAVVTIPASDLTGRFGIFTALAGFDVTVVAQQAAEA